MLARICLLLFLGATQAFRYDGHHGLSVGPLTTRKQAEVVESLREENDVTRNVVIMQDDYPAGSTVDVIVSPRSLPFVKDVLQMADIPYQVVDTDVQKTVDHSLALNAKAREAFKVKATKARAAGNKPPVPDYYMEYDEMVQWMSDTVDEAVAAGVDVQMTEVGRSHEDRGIYIIEVNKNSGLPKVYLDAGIHAREWIAHASAIWMIHEILLGSSADGTDMRTNYEFYLTAVMNPDGYAYTFSNDRFWRKNREPNEGSVCIGTDLNRNWDANWSFCGVSRNPCEDTYSGSAAASCIETQVAMASIEDRVTELDLYITMHSYSQLWLVPWGGSEDKPADYDELMVIAEDVVDAIESVNGLVFVPGTVPDLLYCGAGGSFDWVKNGNPSYDLSGTGLGVKYGYAPELRPASALEGGFDIPPENIDPSGAEVFAGVVAAARGVYPAVNRKH